MKFESYLSLFHPKFDISLNEVLSHGGVRKDGVDIDVFIFHQNDTTVILQFDTDEDFLGYQWYVPIPGGVSDSIFLDKICKDYNMDVDRQNSIIQCIEGELSFSYCFEYLNCADGFIPNRYFIVFYDPICYDTSFVSDLNSIGKAQRECFAECFGLLIILKCYIFNTPAAENLLKFPKGTLCADFCPLWKGQNFFTQILIVHRKKF